MSFLGEIFFNFYGVKVRIATRESQFFEIHRRLREDFEYFLSKECEASLHFELEKGPRTQVKSKRSREKRVFRITESGMQLETLYENVYLALHSAVGEELDLLGYHRVHALGVFSQGQSVLVLLPSGGGKSAMTYLLSKNSQISIYSDEMPLVKGGAVYPFPIRIAMHHETAKALSLNISQYRVFKRRKYPEKILIPIRMNQVARPQPLSHLFVGQVREGDPCLSPVRSFFLVSSLVLSLVVGLGLCQMAEYMLRPDNGWRLIRIFFSRVREAVRIYYQCNCKVFSVNRNAFQNAGLLEGFLVEPFPGLRQELNRPLSLELKRQ